MKKRRGNDRQWDDLEMYLLAEQSLLRREEGQYRRMEDPSYQPAEVLLACGPGCYHVKKCPTYG